jgi:hypothetical protein
MTMIWVVAFARQRRHDIAVVVRPRGGHVRTLGAPGARLHPLHPLHPLGKLDAATHKRQMDSFSTTSSMEGRTLDVVALPRVSDGSWAPTVSRPFSEINEIENLSG